MIKASISHWTKLQKILAVCLFVKSGDYFWSANNLFSDLGSFDSRTSLAGINPLFPSFLLISSATEVVYLSLGILFLAAVFIFVGKNLRWWALVAWYILVCFHNRNLFLNYPSFSYIGWSLLALVAVPENLQSLNFRPRYLAIKEAAWWVLALTLFSSGVLKLLSPSWQEGRAVYEILVNYVAKDSLLVKSYFDALPFQFYQLLTWLFMGLELSVPMALFFKGSRGVLFWLLIFVFCSAIFTLDYKIIGFEMLVFMYLLYEPNFSLRGKKWKNLFSLGLVAQKT